MASWSRTSPTGWGCPRSRSSGASWAVERALALRPPPRRWWPPAPATTAAPWRTRPRARGLACRVFLPERALAARREAIAGEGADVVVVDGTYERVRGAGAGGRAARRRARDRRRGRLAARARRDRRLRDAVRRGRPTRPTFDLLVVPVGVGSLAAAAARFGARAGSPGGGVEPVAAACLTASLAAGRAGVGAHARDDDGRPGLRRGLARRRGPTCAPASRARSR